VLNLFFRNYRIYVAQILPSLVQLDNKDIAEDRKKALFSSVSFCNFPDSTSSLLSNDTNDANKLFTGVDKELGLLSSEKLLVSRGIKIGKEKNVFDKDDPIFSDLFGDKRKLMFSIFIFLKFFIIF
jgi:hypothetical protein